MRIFALLLVSLTATFGQPAANRLELNQLVAEALSRNPEVLAAQKKVEAARQRPAQERSLPDPMFSAGWNSNGNPLPFAGVGVEPTSNVGIMASQEFPAPGKLRLRGEIAAKEADAEAQQYRAIQLSVVSRVKQAYFRLQHAWAQEEIVERTRTLLRSLLSVTEARYSVAKAPQADVLKAQTQLTVLETRLLQVEREKRLRAAEINILLNRPAEAPILQPEEPHMHPLSLELTDLLARARVAAPQLARDQKMMERASVALNLARKDYLPDVTLNGGYYYMGSMPPMYMFRADFKVPLRTARIRAEVTGRSEDVSQARHSFEATAQSLQYRIREDFLMAQTAEKLVDLYSKVVIPQARLTVESSLAAYQTGAADFLSVLTNQMAIIEYEMNYHEQMQEFHLALARLEEITGVEIAQ